MTLVDLIDLTRQVLDDRVSPPLWPSSILAGFLAEAEAEACLRARLLYDSSSTFLTAEYEIGDSAVLLDPRILWVDMATLHWPDYTHGVRLWPTTRALLDEAYPNGWIERTGIPRRFFVDSGWITLYPAPSEAVAVSLVAWRLPLVPLSLDDTEAEPEIPSYYHRHLVDWAVYRAGSYQDQDMSMDATTPTSRPEFYLERFEKTFGKHPGAAAVAHWQQYGSTGSVLIPRI